MIAVRAQNLAGTSAHFPTVADARVPQIGGNLKQFRVGDVHHMALEVPIDDYFMGGIINKYFGVVKDPIYWAVWTDKAAK